MMITSAIEACMVIYSVDWIKLYAFRFEDKDQQINYEIFFSLLNWRMNPTPDLQAPPYLKEVNLILIIEISYCYFPYIFKILCLWSMFQWDVVATSLLLERTFSGYFCWRLIHFLCWTNIYIEEQNFSLAVE